jgi:glycogen debranching enzyme
VPKFALRESGLRLERPARAGAFYDVAGRRAAVFGYEHRGAEVWAYPLKILDGLEVSFRLEGYPLEFSGAATLASVSVRPEATVFTYSHAAFTVRQIVFAPPDAPGVVVLFDAESALPLTLSVSFRPRLRLSWPAGLMTGSLSWDERARAYFITEETKRFVGVVGCPRAREASAMPYQEEPRDVPARFTVEASPEELKSNFVPVVVSGGVEGRDRARAAYERMLASIPALYEQTVAHYERVLDETAEVLTPDERIDEAFAWSKIGVEQGLVTNPLLGTGLVAGYRTSGESERPGFAWYFGRDSLWTALAATSYGDWRLTRTALDFLKKFQRADGKIPHEISQSASLIPWFTDYKYPWDSADATPLYVVAHADHFAASGDLKYLRDNWESVVKAYRFAEATDTDKNGLVENTNFGHGWVEGGDLYPPHEEIYQQGVWIAASRALASLAAALGEDDLRARALAAAERAREATEKTFWLAEGGFYAYATKRATKEPVEAEKGPNRAARQSRLNELKDATLFEENTVLPAVPLWFKALDPARAQGQIDRLGSAALATDWGARILSNESRLYDPLSYHHGSVWPLFTGWASVAAFNHGRPHVGHQALLANALLTYQGALGRVTELLSGDFNAPFGRSSHHQIWSEAMVAAPVLRGLLGLETAEAGNALRFAPQLPADWPWVEVRRIAVGGRLVSIRLTRTTTRTTVNVRQEPADAALASASAPPTVAGQPAASSSPGGGTRGVSTLQGDSASQGVGASPRAHAPLRVTIAPSFPLDARVQSVLVQQPILSPDAKGARERKKLAADFAVTREGDTQRAAVSLVTDEPELEFVFTHDGGTDVYVEQEMPEAGARSHGLRVLRSRAGERELRLLLEGVAGREYDLRVRSAKRVGLLSGQPGLALTVGAGDPTLTVGFDGPRGAYVRRDITIPLDETTPTRRD